MSQSWESYVEGVEAEVWGAYLCEAINNLAFVMDINEYAGLANPLRRIMERDYEKGGGHIDFKGNIDQLKDHLLHIHNFQVNLDNASYDDLVLMHNQVHSEWSEVK